MKANSTYSLYFRFKKNLSFETYVPKITSNYNTIFYHAGQATNVDAEHRVCYAAGDATTGARADSPFLASLGRILSQQGTA